MSDGECVSGLVGEIPYTENDKGELKLPRLSSKYTIDCKILLQEQGWCNAVYLMGFQSGSHTIYTDG